MNRGEELEIEDCPPEMVPALLSRLAQDGCNILVTGKVGQEVRELASQRMFGSTARDRKRILTLTETIDRNPNSFLPDGVQQTSPDVELIDFRSGGRATQVATAATSPSPTSDLTTLSRSICRAISTFERSSELRTQQLRHGLNLLSSIYKHYDPDRFHQFVRQVTSLVKQANGLGFYFANLPDNDSRVDEINQFFDARVELRQQNGSHPEQRWHLYGSVTNWVPL